MGFKDKMKSMATNIKNAPKTIVNGLKPSKEITSTLNEFGTVEKAVMALSPTGTLDKVELIHVQINPSDINYDYEQISDSSIGTLNTSNVSIDGEAKERAKPDAATGSLNFTLNYDFYDEYYARSANGSGLSLNSVLSSGNGFHLKNSDYSSLEKLTEASRHGEHYVWFKWGPFNNFGRLRTVQPRYTAFSPWGEPLKANTYVSIEILNHDATKSGDLLNWYSALQQKINGTTLPSLGGALNKLGSTIKALR